ncbi:DUF551 domain-containing protein [Cronobacter sakazakii]|uniref:DUF551 domain-containing protein n=1 Tax=Cronobacter sakazakii TaxID=28141 RepID=UPI0014123585|nr:DUF551 domain-containing protein [Cronobacter sakazakii]EMC4372027.1 DUF551 domain-containing protein [Cronobacter sakazakii]NHV32509.1 DUF551 domain-containing protein [Cronobacter sakazakii]
MRTISNEVLEKLSVRYRLLAKIHDGSESQAWEESALIVEELLALRKEQERAEPVAYRYRFRPTREAAGKWILVDTLEEANPLPKYEIQPLYTAPPAPVADDSLPFDPQIAEYEQMMEAEQAQAGTTSQQFESLAGKAVGGWIPCSERLPPENTGILAATEFDGPGDWRMKWGTRVPGHPDAKNGWFIPGASWTPSHWQPLPEPPCK